MSIDARPDAPSAPLPVAPGKKVTASWVGFLMALGAIVTAVGAFLPFEKVVFFTDGSVYGTHQFTGLGMSSTTGRQAATLTAGNAGKVLVAVALIVLFLGVFVVRNRGRLWVGIVGLLVSVVGVILGAAAVAAPKSDQKDLNNAAPDGLTIHALGKLGAPISLAGVGIALLACIIALVVRRRRAA